MLYLGYTGVVRIHPIHESQNRRRAKAREPVRIESRTAVKSVEVLFLHNANVADRVVGIGLLDGNPNGTRPGIVCKRQRIRGHLDGATATCSLNLTIAVIEHTVPTSQVCGFFRLVSQQQRLKLCNLWRYEFWPTFVINPPIGQRFLKRYTTPLIGKMPNPRPRSLHDVDERMLGRPIGNSV